ncbi:splicing factor, suppressor of white-apricot homolog isoform X1 [Triticum urartu]|uniref:SURP motif domain-containing protein n=1 Tax=Triticum urartu TaxID=4572 RepID=A0A8R7PUP7_TRIUA|nr:splicing factor, suppressor of white-apricot homolog isoform X1 [Triticum urartu]
MDLQIVGRHALLFDDDAAAEVVNSGGSLVPWSAAGAADLLLDRHDVRHLLDRVPPRPNRAYSVALLSTPSPDGVSEAELDRERFLDLTADVGTGDASPSGNGTDTGQAGYNAVAFSYGGPAGSDDPKDSVSSYRPSFPVPESLLNKLPPSEKVHQIIARTALFVSEHGGQSEIVLRVKQGSNPTFGFLMPDHHLHSYFRYIVDHPQLLKDVSDADTNKGNKIVMGESENAASSSGALSLLGAVYESGDEDEGVLPASSKGKDPGNEALHDNVHKGSSCLVHDNEVKKDQTVTIEAATLVKDKPIFTKKNPTIAGNSIVAAQREKVKDAMTVLTTSTKSDNSKLGVSDTKEMILEPPSFLKGTMEKIVEFILRNGKEFEQKLIEQDRMTGRFPFLLPSNPYHSYYLKMLQETQESKSRGGSSEHKDRRSSSERQDWRSSSERRDRRSSERKDRRSMDRKDRSSSDLRDSGHDKGRGSANKDSSTSDRSSAEPSQKQLSDKQGEGKFQLVTDGAKKELPRTVTADEAAAIVMAATRGLGPANPQPNTLKDTSDIRHIQGSGAVSKPASNSEPGTSVTSSDQLKKEGIGIIDDDWITNTIAKAVAVAASKEADSSEASMTNEQKLKAERLRRAKMFTSIIKGGGNKSDLVTSEITNESARAAPANSNLPVPPEPLATEREGSSVRFEREGSSVRFEREGSNMIKQEKDSDDEQNRARKYRKHHPESDEDKDYLEEESYKHSRKRHRSERSRGHSKDAHKRKHKQHSKEREYRHDHSSSEDELRSSKSRHWHRDDHHYTEDDEHRRHRRSHRSGSKRKHKDDRDLNEQTLGRPEASQNTPEHRHGSEQPPSDTAQSSQAATQVPDELKAKIRAMLLETL